MQNSSKVLFDVGKSNNLMVLPIGDLLSQKLGSEARSISSDESNSTNEQMDGEEEVNQQRESR